MLNPGLFSAYRMALAPNPVALYSKQGNASDLNFLHNTWIPSQFTLQWELRVMPEEAMLRGMARIKLRRIMDRNQPFESPDRVIGDSVSV